MLSKKFTLLSLTLLAVCALASFAFASPTEVNELQAPHDATNAVSCNSCHVPYNTVPQPVPQNWLMNTVCLSCHRSGGAASVVGTHIPAVGDTIGCQKCHNPHESQAAYPHNYIRSEITTPNSGTRAVAFTDSANFIHEAAGNYSGICETCHTQTGVFRNNATGVHPTTASLGQHAGSGKCTNCHKHEDGFKATRNASLCFSCHTSMVSRFDMNVRKNGHPVTSSGQNKAIYVAETNPRVVNKLLVTPSWLSTPAPLQHSSQINCTDCHGDSTGSNGLHGMSNLFIENTDTLYAQLKRVLEPGMNQEHGFNYDLYANQLCYSCHDSVYYRQRAARFTGGQQVYYRFDPAFPGDTTRYMQLDTSRFARHYSHVTYNNANTQERQESCITCHGVHGGSTATQINRSGLVRWNIEATGETFPGQTQPDSLTYPDSLRVITGTDTTFLRSAFYGYYRFVNKVGTATNFAQGTLRDTAIRNANGDTIADYVLGFCYVNCHTGKDRNASHPNNHFGRTVSYRLWRR